MLTQNQIRRLSNARPGEIFPWGDGMMMQCHRAEPYRSSACCRCCALHFIGCAGVRCLKGHLIDDLYDLERRNSDVFFTLHYGRAEP